MKNIKTLRIDIDKKNFEVIPSVQYDANTRFLHIYLLSNSIASDITNCSVKISGTKPDGTDIFNNCNIINAKEGFVEVELTEQMNAVAGTLKCELKIYDGNGVLTTKQFDIEVTASITSKEILSTNEFKALTDAINAVQNIDNRFNMVDEKFNTMTQQLEQNINEVVDARGNENNLKTRFNKMDNDLDNIKSNYALKSEIGAPTDEQINKWLSSHPEATTTVQDGSISWNKLTKELKSNLSKLVKNTIFNSDGSIKEIFNDNYYKLTTMDSNKIIEKWYTDANSLLFTKTTTVNYDGSVSESLA